MRIRSKGKTEKTKEITIANKIVNSISGIFVLGTHSDFSILIYSANIRARVFIAWLRYSNRRWFDADFPGRTFV